jgi:hypothetical protein
LSDPFPARPYTHILPRFRTFSSQFSDILGQGAT